MSHRKIVLILGLAVSVLVPASASAAPTVTVTGDDGNPVTLNETAPVGIRQMNPDVDVTVPQTDAVAYKIAVFAQDGTPVDSESPCRSTQFGGTWKLFADYRGNGTYTARLRYYGNDDCTGTPRERRFQYAINASTGVAVPPTRVLTRAPNTLITNTHQFGFAVAPGAITHEVRYALGGVAGPDGAISGPSTEAFANRTNGLADFRFDRPGRWTIVARAKNDDFFTPWSPAVFVNAVAPFDLERVTFPDARGPRYKLRGQIRERAARGRVSIAIARGRKKGKFRKLGSAKINSKGRFTKRFRVRRTGVYRVRYTYRGSSLVAAGRVTEGIRIRRRIFFG